MALINCFECGNQVSDLAKACPQCGAPLVKSPEASSNTTFASTIPKKSQIQCPFCKSALDAEAITCGYCSAEYGWNYAKSPHISAKPPLDKEFGIALVFSLALSIYSFMLGSSGVFTSITLFFSGLFYLVWIDNFGARKKGKKWWKGRQVKSRLGKN
ncbi:MAG: zinc ribbon domain-containing protein [Enterobacterales bacterium]|nr:zinc ribbon domain-containing protein [Enterobacterales bacterium]